MNLSMQTKRAFVTLSLAAMAMVFVAAKTSLGADQAQSIGADTVHAETVSVMRETLVSPAVIVPVHVAAPILVTKERSMRKVVRMRCESVSNT